MCCFRYQFKHRSYPQDNARVKCLHCTGLDHVCTVYSHACVLLAVVYYDIQLLMCHTHSHAQRTWETMRAWTLTLSTCVTRNWSLMR